MLFARQGGAHVLEAEAERGDGGGIDAHADGGLLVALDGDEADAGDFAEFLGEDGVGEIVDLFSGRVSEVICRVRMGVSAGLTLL